MHVCPPKPHSVLLVPGALPVAPQQPWDGGQLTVVPPDPEPLLEPELLLEPLPLDPPPDEPVPPLLLPEPPKPELLPVPPLELLASPTSDASAGLPPSSPKSIDLPPHPTKTANATRARRARSMKVLSIELEWPPSMSSITKSSTTRGLGIVAPPAAPKSAAADARSASDGASTRRPRSSLAALSGTKQVTAQQVCTRRARFSRSTWSRPACRIHHQAAPPPNASHRPFAIGGALSA